MKSIEEYIDYLSRKSGTIKLSDDGFYEIQPQNEDTETLRMFKNIPTNPKKLVPYATKFREVLIEKIEPKKISNGWVYYVYNEQKYYLPITVLDTIVTTTSLGIRPLLYGGYGVGKTVISMSILTKMFDREPVYVRMHGTPTVEDMVGEIDPIKTYIFSEFIKDLVLQKYSEMPLNELDEHIMKIIELNKQRSILIANIGRALYENRPLVIDEIDKLSKAGSNFLGSLFQRVNPAIQIVGIGMVKAKLPLIAISNTDSLQEFIRSRLEKIKQPHLPPELLYDLLKQYNIEDDIIERAVEKYKEMIERSVENLGTRKIVQWALMEQVRRSSSVTL